MGYKKKLFSILLLGGMIGGVLFAGHQSLQSREKEEKESFVNKKKDSITVWYTDDALTDYISAAAVAYQENHKSIRVEPVLKDGTELIEQVNEATMNDEEVTPDVYLLTNDMLEKAYLAGLAKEVDQQQMLQDPEQFAPSAKAAVTYHGKPVAYPLFYETSVLVYNKTYLMDFAKNQIQSERDQAAGEEAQAEAENGNVQEEASGAEDPAGIVTDEEAWERVREQYLPGTIEQLETLADSYEAPEQVEGIFLWDVTDILYNYAFAGSSMIVGGENGDDPDNIDVYNLDTIKCLTMFQNLNQFFAVETKNVKYENVIQDFIGGKTVFTIGGCDILAKLQNASADGSFAYEYGLLNMPDLTDELKARSRSITTVAAINGYSEHVREADSFAAFLVTTFADNLQLRGGKLPAYKPIAVGGDENGIFYSEYEKTVPMPKLMNAGNFWVRLEIAFTDIWNGADVNKTLKTLSETLMEQMTGEYAEEEYIDVPIEQEEEIEYIDEDAAREAANSSEGE